MKRIFILLLLFLFLLTASSVQASDVISTDAVLNSIRAAFPELTEDEWYSYSEEQRAGLMVFALISSLDDSKPEEEITAYVKAHLEQLAAAAATADPVRDEDIPALLGEDTIVKSIYRYSPGIVQFFCGGTGLSVASTYTGFYFSETDTPYAMEFQGAAEFDEAEDGSFFWESADGEKAFRTVRILPQWFYYWQDWE